MSGRWRNTHPDELRSWLESIDVPWALAGGWALDLWGGTVTREHSDIEIACVRRDLPELLRQLPGFEIAIARNKQLSEYQPGHDLPDGPFSCWLRRHKTEPWDFEIVTETQVDGTWAYRRAPAVRRPMAEVFVPGPAIRIINPAVQLLYKCSAPRPKDLQDLRNFVPRLPAAEQAWLIDAVAAAHPDFSATLAELVR